VVPSSDAPADQKLKELQEFYKKKEAELERKEKQLKK